MLIYIKKENIFFDNVNCCESIYDFFYAHQNYKKKKLVIKFIFSAEYDVYVPDYLMGIKDPENDQYDMLTSKNSKFLFYH